MDAASTELAIGVDVGATKIAAALVARDGELVDSDQLRQETVFERRRLDSPNGKYRRDPFRHVLCPPLAAYQRRVLEARLARTDWRAIPAPRMPAVPEGLPPGWRSARPDTSP